ncbi:hypothetical protein [Hyphomicrobium sp.]|uniref:hypothetical protein n=1 Tax=Hyphomicrobium sp. TaxID=82 RepID=UPI003568D7CC
MAPVRWGRHPRVAAQPSNRHKGGNTARRNAGRPGLALENPGKIINSRGTPWSDFYPSF